MFEVIQLFKDENYKQKVMLVILSSASAYTVLNSVQYAVYWQEELSKLAEKVKSIPLEAAGNLPQELNLLIVYKNSIIEFISKDISNSNIPSYEDLKKKEISSYY